MKQQKLFAAILCAAAPLAYAATDTLDEIVVTATRIAQPLSQSLTHTTVINQKDIQDSQAVDVPSVLKNLAGVEIYQSGGIGQPSSLFLRGTNSSHTLVLLDGVRINSATTGATAIDQLMLDQIERIEVVRGNVSSLYGSEAIGGVIQIFTKQGKGEPAFNASGGIGSHNTQRITAGLGGENNGTAFNVQMSKYKTSGVSAIKPDMVPTANPDRDGYDNTSLSGNMRYAFNSDHALTASVFGSDGDVQYDSYGFGVSPQDVHMSKAKLHKFSIGSENRFTENWQSKLQLAQGVDDSQNFTNGIPSWNIKTTSDQLGWQNTLSFGSQRVLLGVENVKQDITSDTPYTRPDRWVNSAMAGYTGQFGAHQMQLNLRQDRYSDFGMADTWLAGYGYVFSADWRVTASLSTAFKAPTFNDMYAPVAWGGNPNLLPEHSRNAEIGVHYMANDQRLDAVYFDNRLHNLIVYQFPLTVNLDQARSDGLEVSYTGQFSNTGVKAALTLQNPRDTQTGLALLRRAKAYGNVGVTRKIGAWQVGGELQHSNERADIDINTFARTTLGSYNVVNLTANYAFDKRLNLSLRADNLFDSDYMLAHGYNTLGRTLFAGVSYQR